MLSKDVSDLYAKVRKGFSYDLIGVLDPNGNNRKDHKQKMVEPQCFHLLLIVPIDTKRVEEATLDRRWRGLETHPGFESLPRQSISFAGDKRLDSARDMSNNGSICSTLHYTMTFCHKFDGLSMKVSPLPHSNSGDSSSSAVALVCTFRKVVARRGKSDDLRQVHS